MLLNNNGHLTLCAHIVAMANVNNGDDLLVLPVEATGANDLNDDGAFND